MHAKKKRDRSLKNIKTNKKKQNKNKEYILGREFRSNTEITQNNIQFKYRKIASLVTSVFLSVYV